MKYLLLSTCLLFVLQLSSIKAQDYSWYDTNLTKEERIEALIEAMTVDEKIGQLVYNAPGIPHLGILPYNWWNECLHGVARNGRATVFPQPVCLASTFDDELALRVATAISDEARAKFNIAQSMENYSQYAGLTFWTPNVNIFRDPRWGRGMETYGEDPYLMSRMGTSIVKGIQGNDPNHLKAAACAKHYAVHSGPEEFRHEFDAVASKKDFYETYLPAFEALVKDANVEIVMGAYNRVYGDPACGSELLLKDLLRDQWGFEGHVVSDCWAISDFHLHHKVTPDVATSSAMALKAGTDLNCGDSYPALKEALERELISEEDINTALRRLLNTKIKLGLLDPKGSTPWDKLDESVVECEEHVNLSREVAQKGIVMLKNKNNILPLKKDIRNLYITGPNASTSEVLMGNYFGLSSHSVTILDGIMGKVSAGTSVNYTYGVLPYQMNINPIDWSTGGAKSADATIAVLGLSGLMEGEEGEAIASDTKGDRININLPESQLDFLRRMKKDNDKPIIVVITGGCPMTIPEVDSLADAIIWAWYPGQQGGNAVADIIFGDVNPSGRLPITFPKSVDQLPPYEDYSMKGRTYRYMKEQPLYPFGFGLSFTEFEYSALSISSDKIKKDTPLNIEVSIKNTGKIKGNEVAQLYLTCNSADFDVPLSSLVGFKSIMLEAGEEKIVKFTLNPEQLKTFNNDGEKIFLKGNYTLHVGGSSPGERSKALTGKELLTHNFTLK